MASLKLKQDDDLQTYGTYLASVMRLKSSSKQTFPSPLPPLRFIQILLYKKWHNMPKAELLTHMPNPVPSILVAHAGKPHIILNLLLPFYYYIYQSASPIDNISHLHPHFGVFRAYFSICVHCYYGDGHQRNREQRGCNKHLLRGLQR